jgi:hypothetical protein
VTGQYRDSFGDPAYLDGALGRLETGQPLRAVDLQELSYAIGREAALKLARTAEEDRARRAKAPRRPSGWWGRLFGGPIHTEPELPTEVIRLIATLRAGRRLVQVDADTATRAVGRSLGRAATRAATRRLRRGTRIASRAVSRAQARNATRRQTYPRGRRSQ